MNATGWTVNLEFRIHGASSPGGDGKFCSPLFRSVDLMFCAGMAFWYIDSPQEQPGPVFGGPTSWVGLGVFIDTYDNDHKVCLLRVSSCLTERRYRVLVCALWCDGTLSHMMLATHTAQQPVDLRHCERRHGGLQPRKRQHRSEGGRVRVRPLISRCCCICL